MAAIVAKKIVPGDVVMIRHEAPRGAPACARWLRWSSPPPTAPSHQCPDLPTGSDHAGLVVVAVTTRRYVDRGTSVMLIVAGG
jgi:hypothetical protein